MFYVGAIIISRTTQPLKATKAMPSNCYSLGSPVCTPMSFPPTSQRPKVGDTDTAWKLLRGRNHTLWPGKAREEESVLMEEPEAVLRAQSQGQAPRELVSVAFDPAMLCWKPPLFRFADGESTSHSIPSSCAWGAAAPTPAHIFPMCFLVKRSK